MDKLSGLASKVTGNKQESSATSSTTGASGSSTQDYLDKGIQSVEQRVGGDKYNADQMRSTNEKIASTIKDKFKTATGHDLPGTSSTSK